MTSVSFCWPLCMPNREGAKYVNETEWLVAEVDRVLGRPRGIRIGEAPDRDGRPLVRTGFDPRFARTRSDRAFWGAWLFGARVGIGADSPIGPFRLQYGLSTRGRRQWFARIGRWI